MPNEDNNILKYNHGENFMKAPFIIYADMQSSLEKISTCHNNLNGLSTTKINKHTPSGYSLFIHCSLKDSSKNYKLKFIDSFRFMSTSLSNLIDNLSEKVHSDKCTDCKSCLDYILVEDNQLIFKCSKCNKNHNKDFNKDLIDLQAHVNFVMETLINLFSC